MMLSQTLQLVSPGLHGGVLTVLSRTEKPLTGRTVASLVQPKASVGGVQKVLNSLVSDGLVHAEPAGRAKLYQLNRDHVAAPLVQGLVHLREELLERIRAETERWMPRASAVWMFGSAARGEAGPESDIDILVVRTPETDADNPTWVQQLQSLSEHVTAWSGNGCEMLELGLRELTAAVNRDDRLVAELRRDAIHLSGVEPRKALRPKAARR